MKKRTVGIVMLSAAVMVSGYFIIQKERENHRAYVQHVSDIQQSGYDISSSPLSGSGIISDSAQQEIRLQDGEKVSEIYVRAGDTVQKDQKLFTYDTASLSLNLQSEQLSLEQAQNTLNREQKKLSQITDIKAVSDTQKKKSSDSLNTLSQQASEAETAIDDYRKEHADELLQKAFDVDDDPSVIRAQNAYDSFCNGTYTSEEQAQIDSFHASGDTTGLQDYISLRQNTLSQNLTDARNTAVQQRKEAYENFCNGDCTAQEQKQINALQAKADQAEKAYQDAMNRQDQIVTASDKASMIRTQQVAVMKAQNSVSSAQADVKAANAKLQNAVVKAGMDGTVTSLMDVNQSVNEGKPFLVISSAGGVSVTGAVSEYDIHQVKAGDQIQVTDYVSGSETKATILSISSFPDQSGQISSDSSGNANVTYYPFTAVLKNPDGFQVGDSIDYQPVKDKSQKTICLSRAYIRMDAKGAYALIDNGGGKLKRQNLDVTPSRDDPQTVIVTKGLKKSDLIAFPYGKKAYEGNETTEKEQTNLLGF